MPVVDAAELAARADRPVHRHGVDPEHLLDLADQVERVAAVAVHLVHEREDRDVAQAADLEELARLRLRRPCAASISITAESAAMSVR